MSVITDPETTRRYKCEILGCNGIHIPNLPLLRKVYEFISDHPEEWNQQHWGWREVEDVNLPGEVAIEIIGNLCKTSYCFAGHAVNMTGWKFELDNGCLLEDGEEELVFVNRQEDSSSIEDAAIHELGLTGAESSYLFNADNSLTYIREFCEELAELVGEKFLG